MLDRDGAPSPAPVREGSLGSRTILAPLLLLWRFVSWVRTLSLAERLILFALIAFFAAAIFEGLIAPEIGVEFSIFGDDDSGDGPFIR